ncbi:MAG: hypothetical protein ABIK82_00915 [Pseudomonadota bacterium]
MALTLGVAPLSAWNATQYCSGQYSPQPLLLELGQLHMALLERSTPKMALNRAPFGRWTLRDKAAQRRSP